MTAATKTKITKKTAAEVATSDAETMKLADDITAERAKGAIESTQDQKVAAEVEATKAPAKVAKSKAPKAPKAKVEKTPKAKTMHPKTAARLAFITSTEGKHTVSDVRKGTGPTVSPWDRATRDSLRQLVAAGLISSEKSAAGVEVFFALASVEGPAAS